MASCAWRSSRPRASRGPRPAGSATSSTRSRVRSGRWRAGLRPVIGVESRPAAPATVGPDVYLPLYRGVPVRESSVLARSTVRVPDPSAPDGLRDVGLVDVAGDGYRLRLIDHPPAFDREGYLRRRRGRLPGQRVAVRALLPRRPRRQSGPTAGSTCCISTTGMRRRRCCSATGHTTLIRSWPGRPHCSRSTTSPITAGHRPTTSGCWASITSFRHRRVRARPRSGVTGRRGSPRIEASTCSAPGSSGPTW